MSAVLSVNNIRKKYGDIQAVSGVSFAIPEGRIYGLVGADGAGKTTLMRILTTLIPPDEGDGTILNHSLLNDTTFIRSAIGYMPQQFSLFGDLSVMENILFFADVFGVRGKVRNTRISDLLSFSRLSKFTRRPAAKLSGGMKQKLALCCALVHTPKVLLLDEPTTGVDPVSRREFWEILHKLRSNGISILVSTPYMDEATWCDELLFLHNGQVLCKGTPEGLLATFPSYVFRVTGAQSDKQLHCRTDIPLPEGIERFYPSGGILHVISRDASLTPEKLFEIIRTIVPEAAHVEKCKPEMEDLFFHLIVTNPSDNHHNKAA